MSDKVPITLHLEPVDSKYLSLRQSVITAKSDDGVEIEVDLAIPASHLVIQRDGDRYILPIRDLVDAIYQLPALEDDDGPTG